MENEKLTLSVIEGLTKDYDAIWVLDGENLEMHLFRSNGPSVISGAVEIGKKYVNYQDVMHAYVNKYVCEEDRARVKKIAEPKYVFKQLEKSPSFTITYQRQDEDGKKNYHQMVFATTNINSADKAYVLGFKNVDAAVRAEMEQVAKTERIKQYESDARTMELIHESLGSGSWSMDLNEDYEIVAVHWSDVFRHLLGYKNEKDFPNELESWSDLIYGDDKEFVMHTFYDAIYDYTNQKNFDLDYRMYTNKKGVRWFKAAGRLSRRKDGSPISFVGIFKDVDEQKIREQKLNEQLEIVEALSRDYRNIYKINLTARSARIVKMEGYLLENLDKEMEKEYSYDSLMRMYIKERVLPEDAKMLSDAMKAEVVKKALENNEEYISTFRTFSNNEIHYFQFKYIRLHGEIDQDQIIVGFKNVVAVVNAAHERESLILMSETDLMTTLLNRKCGERKTCEAMKLGGMYAILDIDNFKHFNDTYGHSVGDKVIIAVAESLKNAFREADIIYRLGGDEFAVFAPNIFDMNISEMVMNRFFDILSEVKIPEICKDKVTTSVGVRILPGKNEVSFEELYRTTDACTYKSKNIKGNYITYFK